MKANTLPRSAFTFRLAFACMAAIPLAACNGGAINRSVESVKQPVVSHSSFVYDLASSNGLTSSDRAQLDGWFSTIGLGYGDRVMLSTDGNEGRLLDDVGDVAANYGLLVESDVARGAPRVTVKRAVAHVPSCPDWRTRQEADGQAGTSSNYGCATNANLAAMVANPEDLVRGQIRHSDLRTATSNRAIRIYQEKVPTGSGDLKDLGGN